MGTRPLTRPSARRLSSPSLGRRGGVGRPRRLAVGRPFPLRFGSGRQSAILAPSGGRRPPEGLNGGQRTRRATGAALVGPSAISSFYPAAIPSPFRRLCAACSPTVDESRLPFIVFGSAGKRWTECFCHPPNPQTCVELLRGFNGAPPGLVRPTEYSHHATTSSSQTRDRSDLDPGFERLQHVTDKMDHFTGAEGVKHPLEDITFNLPEDQVAALDAIRQFKHLIPAMRLERLAALREVSERLRPLSAEIISHSKDHVKLAVGDAAHPAFAVAVIMAIEWPGTSFPSDHFVRGHDVIGALPDFHLWREKSAATVADEAAERLDVRVLEESNASWNASLADRLSRSYAAASRKASTGDIKALYDFRVISDITRAERDAGLVEILPLSALAARFKYGPRGPLFRADERFIVRQGAKPRPCENCRASNKNAACTTRQKITLAPPRLGRGGGALPSRGVRRRWLGLRVGGRGGQ